jgi:hypothetical protein
MKGKGGDYLLLIIIYNFILKTEFIYRCLKEGKKTKGDYTKA